MKRFLSLLLAGLMVLSLCACDGSTVSGGNDKNAQGFMVGFGEGDITPLDSVPLQGYGNHAERMSTGILSYLYSHALVVRDGAGNTAVIISVDSACVTTDLCKNLRNDIESATKIPYENILITSIHQHSTPDPVCGTVSSSADYKRLFLKNTVKAVEKALDDLAPCEIYINTVETESLNFVRNYIMNDGTICGDGYGSSASGYKAHESEADRNLQLIKFVREGQTTQKGKEAKDIILANFWTHPHSGANDNYYNAHADAPGIFRDAVEKKTKAHVMYINGAGANINQVSRFADENKYSDYKARGEALARYAIDAEDSYTKVNAGTVKTTIQTVDCENDHSMDHLLADAQKVYNYWKSTNNSTDAMKQTTNKNIHSVYHAEAIVTKVSQPATQKLDMVAISFGDIAICGGPYEMYDTNGVQVKEGSPMKMTFLCNMANGSIGYIPSQWGYDKGCYSADITKVAPGSGEKLAQVLVDILNEQAGK